MPNNLGENVQCLKSILCLLNRSCESKEEIEDVLVLHRVEDYNLIQAFSSLIWQWDGLLGLRIDSEILNPKFLIHYL